MQQLSGLDASFLYMETGAQFGHVGSLTLYDQGEARAGLAVPRAARHAARAPASCCRRSAARIVESAVRPRPPVLDRGPELRPRLPHPTHCGAAPGTNEQLAELVSHLHASPLDRSRPLWQLWVIEGLENGQNRALREGAPLHDRRRVGGRDDLDRCSTARARAAHRRRRAERWRPERIPGDAEMLARGLAGLALQPGKARALRDPHRARPARHRRRCSRRSPTRSGSAGCRGRSARGAASRSTRRRCPQTAAPHTSFNRSITPHRRFAFITLSLEDARRVRKAFGTTLNDVVMALCAGALRRF